MAKRSTYLILCITAISQGLATGPDKNFLNNGRATSRLQRLDISAQKTSELVKNLNIAAPSSVEKLRDMANDTLSACRSAVYEINQGIPSIKDGFLQTHLFHISDSFNEVVANKIERCLHCDPEKLKHDLSAALVNLADLARVIPFVLTSTNSGSENAFSNHFRKATSEFYLGVLKLKHEIGYFNTKTRNLESEVHAGLEAFSKALQNIKNEDDQAREDLIYFIQDVERVVARAVAKLENFVNFNSGDENNMAIVRRVSKGLGESGDAFRQLTSGNQEVAQLKTEFETLYKTTTNFTTKLVKVEISEKTKKQLLIRSVLFDSIALSHYGEREISSNQL